MAQYPSVGEMISSHTLAHNIITRHNTPNDVLDDHELSMLRRFCLDPASKSSILESEGMLDYTDAVPGTAASQVNRSLVGVCIARHDTDNPFLLDSEIDVLRDWFNSLNVDLSHGARDMLQTHTLAYNLINRPFDIFEKGGNEFRILKRFCSSDFTHADQLATLSEFDMADAEGDAMGTRARNVYGSLGAHCVATWGTERSALTVGEVELLKEWFRNGGPVGDEVPIAANL